MKKNARFLTTALCALGMTVALGVSAAPALAEVEDDPYKVLVVGKTLGFRHSHIDDTTVAVTQLGAANGFTVDVWDPAQTTLTLPSSPFTTAEDLSKYSTIIFASPVDGTNNLDPNKARLLDDTELAAFQGYIRGGGGYVGLHAATDSLHTVPWYSQLTGGGARFASHPANQTATMRVENPAHPSTTMLPKEWVRFDEWYNFTTNPREDVHVLITLDESTYNPGRNAMGADHPLSWCKNFEGGRSWYEGAGHTDESWTDPLFLEHILKGIQWTAGLVSGGGDCVTFPEATGVLASATTDANAALAAEVGAALTAAKALADDDQHVDAIRSLRQAQAKAAGISSETLTAKLDDLIEWQQALSGGGLDVSADATTRCVAGKTVLTVKLVSAEAAPVAAHVSTTFGGKSMASIATGKASSYAFTTRLAAVPAGAAEVTVTGTVDGEPVTEVLEAAYAAHNCG